MQSLFLIILLSVWTSSGFSVDSDIVITPNPQVQFPGRDDSRVMSTQAIVSYNIGGQQVADSFNWATPFEGSITDVDTTPCPTAECPLGISTVSEPFVLLTGTTLVRDCSCKGSRETGDFDQELSDLRRICACYLNQNNVHSNLASGVQGMTTAFQTSQNLNNAFSNITDLFGYMAYGAGIQASYADVSEGIKTDRIFASASVDETAAPAVPGAVAPVAVPGIVKDRAGPVPSASIANDRAYLRTKAVDALGKMNKNGASFSLGEGEIPLLIPDQSDYLRMATKPRELTAKNCTSMKQYNLFKQTSREDAFYESIDQAGDDPALWSLSGVLRDYENAVGGGDERSATRLKARARFLVQNPLYASLLSSEGKDSANLKKELLGRIKASFAPCPNKKRFVCAYERQKKRMEDDKKFFKRAEVQKATREGTKVLAPNLIGSVIGNLESFLATPSLPSLTVRAELPAAMSYRSWSNKSSACTEVKAAAHINQSVGHIGEGKRASARMLLSLSEEFNPDPAKNPRYQEFQQNICSSRQCPKNQKPCADKDMLSFEEFYEKTYKSTKNCAAEAPDKKDQCWLQAQETFKEGRWTPETREDWEGLAEDEKINASFARFIDNNRGFLGRKEAENVVVTAAETQTAQLDFISTRLTGDGRTVSSESSSPNGVTRFENRSKLNFSSDVSGEQKLTDHSSVVPKVTPQAAPQAAAASALPGPAPAQDFSTYYSIPAGAAVPAVAREAVVRDIQANRDQATALSDHATALASAAVATPDLTERRRLEAQIAEVSAKVEAADRNAKLLTDRLAEAEARASGRATARSRRVASVDDAEEDTDSQSTTSSDRTTSSTGGAIARPQLNPQTSLATPASSQSYGSGSSSYSLPPITLPKVRGAAGRSGAVNFDFKYGADAKQGTTGGPGIIVAGNSSAFESSESFAAAVNESEKVDIGTVSGTEAQQLSARNPDAIEKYRQQIKDAPGNLVRLSFTTPNGVSEIVVAKNADGTFFVPAVRNLARARLAAMKAILPTGL